MRKWFRTHLVAVFAIAGTSYIASPATAGTFLKWAQLQNAANVILDQNEYCRVEVENSRNCDFIDGQELVEFLRGVDDNRIKNVTIVHSSFSGPVDFSQIDKKIGISFVESAFESEFSIFDAHIGGDLIIKNSKFSKGIAGRDLHLDGRLIIVDEPRSNSGSLDFTGSIISGGVDVLNSTLSKELIFRRASIGKRLIFRKSTFGGGIAANFADIAGSLSIGEDTIIENAPLNLEGTSVAGRVDIFEAEIKSPVFVEGMVIKGDLYLTGSKVDGVVAASGAQIQGDLLINTSHFKQGLKADRLTVNGSVLVKDGTVVVGQPLDLDDSTIAGIVSIEESTLKGGLTLRRTKVGASLTITNKVELGPTDLRDSFIGRDVTIESTTVEGPPCPSNSDCGALFAKGISVGGTLYMGQKDRSFREISGRVDLLEARVTGNIEIWHSTFASPFLAPLLHVDHSVFIHESEFKQGLTISGAVIGQHLDVAGNKMRGLDLTRSMIGADLRLQPDKNHQYETKTTWLDDEPLDLDNAQAGVLQDENTRTNKLGDGWPHLVKLLAFTYHGFGDPRSLQWGQQWLQRDLHRQDKGSTNDLAYQPDKSLAAYFRSIGDDDDADEVLVDAKEDLRSRTGTLCRQTLAVSTCVRYFEMSVLGYGIDYGLSNWKLYVAGWLAFWLLAGIFVLSYYRIRDFLMGKVNPFDVRTVGWCAGASLSRLLPGLDLKDFAEFFKAPVGLARWQIGFFYIHAAVGFVLTLLVVAALTGLIQTK